MLNRIITSLVLVYLMGVSVVSASIINVPGDQSTIQAGIDGSSEGDTVLIQPGTYVENINFNGKNIVVGSLFLVNADTSYISSTIIDGNQNGSVVTIVQGETRQASLIGFTIQNGFSDIAGGIRIANSSPCIQNNKIISNTSTGIGGGIYISCANSASAKIENNSIINNQSGIGGGIYINGNTHIIKDLLIENNEALSGGGAEVRDFTGIIENVTLAENRATTLGSALASSNSEFNLVNCLVSDNLSAYNIGVLNFSYCSPINLINSSILHNNGLKIVSEDFSSVNVLNGIIWDELDEIIVTNTGGTITVNYSNIIGGWSGMGNIDLNPLFINTTNQDYHPSDYSPCLGAGIDSIYIDGDWYHAPSTDIGGNPRPNPMGSNPDMGSFENILAEPIQFIESVYPTQNSLNIGRNAVISVTFVTDIDPATINSNSIVVHTSQSWLHTDAYSYNSETKTATIDLDNEFAAGENVNVTLTSVIQTTGGYPIIPFQWSFTVVTYGGSGTFLDKVDYNANGDARSIAPSDFDGDDDIDIAVATEGWDAASIFMNNGDGDFTHSGYYDAGGSPLSITLSDFDNDGDMDAGLANSNTSTVSVLLNSGDGTFASDVEYGVGSSPWFTTSSDLDNDGDTDLIVVNNSSYTISVLKNQGDGSFESAVDYNTGDRPESVETADYDNDGDIDIAVTNEVDHNVSIFMNNGNGIFSAEMIYSVGSNPKSVVSQDLDGDSDMDLAVANSGSNDVSILLNNGDGTFSDAIFYSVGIGPRSIISQDIDSDGDNDLAVANRESNSISILINSGDGSLTFSGEYITGEGPSTVSYSDVDGDLDLDLIVANATSQSITVLLNRNSVADIRVSEDTLQFSRIHIGQDEEKTFWIYNEAVDSTLELASIQSSGSSFIAFPSVGSILPNDSLSINVTFAPDRAGTILDSLIILSNDPMDSVIVVTVSGEGDPIVSHIPAQNALTVSRDSPISVSFGVEMNPATFNSSNFIAHGSLTGMLSGTYSYVTGTNTVTLDLDDELAVGEQVNITLTSGIQSSDGYPINPFQWSFTVETLFGSGYYANREYFGLATYPESIYSSDLDSDGDMDIIYAHPGSTSNSISEVFNTGDGSLIEQNTIPVGTSPASVFLADLDSDGDMDIVTANTGSNNISVLLKISEGTYDEQSTYNVGIDPTSVFLVDLDSDGNIDVVTANSGSNNISVLLNFGDGTFVEHSTYAAGNDPESVFLADLDSDGDMDIVTVNTGSNNISVLLNFGDGTFDEHSTYAAGNDPESVFLADLDSDGDIDIVTANSGSNNISVFLNFGDGTLDEHTTYAVGNQPESVLLADIDSDGDIDAITSNNTGNNISVLQNIGNGSFIDPITYDYGGGALNSNDFDGDGDIDVVTTIQGSGGFSIWFNIDAFGIHLFLDGEDEQSSTIEFGYEISIPENDSVNLLCEYSIDIGTNWNMATVMGDTSDLSSAAFVGTIIWDSDTDLPGQDIPDVQFRITPSNSTGTGLSGTMTFHLDNNDIPIIIADDLTGEQSADIALNFSYSDSELDTLTISGEYQKTGEDSWNSATLSGDIASLADNEGIATWSTITDLPYQSDEYFLRLFAHDNDPSIPDTLTISLDNYHQQSISLMSFTEEQEDSITITYVLEDETNDYLDLFCEYRESDSSSWELATIIGDTSNIGTDNYNGNLTWLSRVDFPGLDISGVSFRVIPDDDWASGFADTILINLNNNYYPTITLSPIAGEQVGDIDVGYVLTDVESDQLSIICEFQILGETTWQAATVQGTTNNISNYSDFITWNSDNDLTEYAGNVDFRITPHDNDLGTADTITILIDQIGAAFATFLEVPEGELSEDIIINYQVEDDEGDTIDIKLEYSFDEGLNWVDGTCFGNSGILPSNYQGSFIWKSYSNLPGFDNYAMIRINPWDGHHWGGLMETGLFHLDNNLAPSVTIQALPDTLSIQTEIGYILADEEQDTLSLTFEYSINLGETWCSPTPTGHISEIPSTGYSGALNWSIIADLGFQRFSGVQLKFTPVDLDIGVGDTISGLTILNYPGDFTGDFEISTDDMAILASAWNSEPQDLLYEIGPATGIVPELIPDPDDVLDFEDLAVFVQMWNWSYENNGLARPSQLARGNTDTPKLLNFDISKPQDKWLSDGNTSIIVKSEFEHLLQVEWILEHNGEFIVIKSMEGDYFNSRYQTSPVLSQESSDSTLSLFCVTGLGWNVKQNMSNVIGEISVSNQSKAIQPITVYYRVWDDSAIIVESGQMIVDIESYLPDEFTLMQNFPNPFNPNTTIRYTLPSPSEVTLSVFDITGRTINTLADTRQPAGYYDILWNGTNNSGTPVSAGVYFFRLQAGEYTKTIKMVYLR